MQKKEKVIGVVGGVGPSAGVYLLSKIIEETNALTDSDHLEVYLSSDAKIPDRTQFLLSAKGAENPRFAIEKSINNLCNSGAQVIGIACNTAHSSKIIGGLTDNGDYDFVSMIESVKMHIVDFYGDKIKVGLLATEGTYFSKIYDEVLDNFTIIKPDDKDIKLIQETIYKIKSGIVSNAKSTIQNITDMLNKKGAEIVILGCTELPLVVEPRDLCIPFLDTSRILARQLIHKSAPWKLKKYWDYSNFSEDKSFYKEKTF